jgi:hypothetical protein
MLSRGSTVRATIGDCVAVIGLHSVCHEPVMRKLSPHAHRRVCRYRIHDRGAKARQSNVFEMRNTKRIFFYSLFDRASGTLSEMPCCWPDPCSRKAPCGQAGSPAAYQHCIVALAGSRKRVGCKPAPILCDDAEIAGAVREVESWSSSADNTDRIYVFSPACVVKVGIPMEIGLSEVNSRSNGFSDTTLSLTGKTVLLPIGPSDFGLALSGAVVFDLIERRSTA